MCGHHGPLEMHAEDGPVGAILMEGWDLHHEHIIVSVTISSTYIYVTLVFSFIIPRGLSSFIILCLLSRIRYKGLVIVYKYGTIGPLFGHRGLRAIRATGYSYTIVVLLKDTLVCIAIPRPCYLGGCGWLWIGHAR